MPPTGNNACKVMIGGIPKYVTDAMLRPILEEAGQVKQLDFVHDGSGTGSHKGVAYAEYHDESSARAAVQNLHKRAINGVPLRISLKGEQSDRALMKVYETEQRQLVRLLLPVDTPVTRALREVRLTDAYEAVNQMKHLIARPGGRDLATSFFDENPQVALAFLHILYHMGAVNSEPEAARKTTIRAREKKREKRDDTIQRNLMAKRHREMGVAGPAAPAPPVSRPPASAGVPVSTLEPAVPVAAAASAAPTAAPEASGGLPMSSFEPPAAGGGGRGGGAAAAAAPAAAPSPSPSPPPTEEKPAVSAEEAELEKKIFDLPLEDRQMLVQFTPEMMEAAFPEEQKLFMLKAQAAVKGNPQKYL